jgi:uncharacterized protein
MFWKIKNFEVYLICFGLITWAVMLPPFAIASGGPPGNVEAPAPLAANHGTHAPQGLLLAKTAQEDAKASSVGSVSSGRSQGASATKKPTAKRGNAGKPEKKRNKVEKSKKTAPARQTAKPSGKARRNREIAPPDWPVEAPGPGLSILVVGDSLAVGVGMTLDSAFAGRGKLTMKKMGRISSGLDSPGNYDWNRALKDALNRERFDLVVVMLGANDAHNSPGTPAWGRLYESKYTEFLRITAEKHVHTLVVALPPMRKADFCQRVKLANTAIRNAAQQFSGNCVYIDAFSRFADEGGNFTDQIRWGGEWKKVRAGDGVHFTGTGYLLLSRMVADEAMRRTGASVRNTEMNNFDMAPLVAQVLSHQAPVAVVRRVLAAQQAPPVDQLARNSLLDLPVGQELQEIPCIRSPALFALPVGLQNFLRGAQLRQVVVVDAADGSEEKSKIVPLGKAGQLGNVV